MVTCKPTLKALCPQTDLSKIIYVHRLTTYINDLWSQTDLHQFINVHRYTTYNSSRSQTDLCRIILVHIQTNIKLSIFTD